MYKFFKKNKNLWLKLIFIILIPLIPTAFFLKNGFFLNGDAVFPVDHEVRRLFLENSFNMWLGSALGSDYFWGFRAYLLDLVCKIFAFNLDFAQFFANYIIFFFGSLGVFLLSKKYIKSVPFRGIAMLLYIVNIWVVSTPTFMLIQGVFVLPLLLYFYISFVERGNLKFLLLHMIFFFLLGTMHCFILYAIIITFYNVSYLTFSRENYFKNFKRNFLVLFLSTLTISFFVLPFLFNFFSKSPDTLVLSKQAFATQPAYKFYSGDQTVLNSMRLISVERLFSFIYTSSHLVDKTYAKILHFFSMIYIVLVLLYFLVNKKINKKTIFLMALFIFGIFLSSFHNLTDINFVKKFVMAIYPPVSVDSTVAIPLVMLPASIMIGFVLENLFNKVIKKVMKYLLATVISVFFIFYSFFVVYPFYSFKSYSQIPYETLKKNAFYIREIVGHSGKDSALLIYPISTMHVFPYSNYLLSYHIIFPYDKILSFFAVQTSYPWTREFANRIIYPNKDTFSPKFFRQIGINRIVLLKNVVNEDLKYYLGLKDYLIKSGFSLKYEDDNFIFYQADDYAPLIHVARPIVVDGEKEDLFQFIAKGNFEIGNSVLFPSNNLAPQALQFIKNYNNLYTNNEDLPKIKFEKINPSKYRVHVNTPYPFFLVFSESYNPQWRVYFDNPLSTTETPKNGLHDISYLFKKRYLIGNHFFADGYSNAWYIDKTGEYDLVVFFQIQSYFLLGFILSGLSLIVVVAYIFYKVKYKKGSI